MSLKYGDMLWMDHEDMGTTLLMVINPPIICEYCKTFIKDWELDEDGVLICPICSNQIKEFNRPKCNCGNHDMIATIVATNNNFHSSNDGVTPYQHKLNWVTCGCERQTEEDIRKGKLRLLSHDESVYRRRLLVWTSLDEYDPSAPMPDWIKEKIK